MVDAPEPAAPGQVGDDGQDALDGSDGDGQAVLHRERVLPSPGYWFAAPAVAALSGLAAAPTGVVPAVVAGAVAVLAVVVGLLRASPVVEVTTTTLTAGRARIRRGDLGAAVGYDGEDARLQRGPDLDARAHLVMRGWADGVVRVEVVDDTDPVPYWLLSTHRPAELARALQAPGPHRRLQP